MELRDVTKCLGDQRQGAVQGGRHSSSTVSSPVHAKYDTAGHSRHRWHPVAKGWRPISLRRTRRRFKLHEPAMDDLGAHPARVHVRLCMCARPTNGNAHMLPHMRNRAMATRPRADAIDATDVAVLWMPSCLALPERLVIGSDGRSPSVKTWLLKQARMSGLLNSTTAAPLARGKSWP